MSRPAASKTTEAATATAPRLVRAVRRESNVKNWNDMLAVLGYLLFCLTLSLSAAFMMWEVVEHAHPEWKSQPWGTRAYIRQRGGADPF